MKRPLSFFLYNFIFIIFFITSTKAVNQYGIHKVVIDAGHGGHDPGCVNKSTKEKDIALNIAKKLGNYITSNFSDVEVIYTREDDSFVELYRRAQIANENNADLFISIHCNSSPQKTSYGTETFVMGLHKSDANLEVAKKENAAILYEDNYTEKYDGFDPNSPEANIIFSLYQNAFLEQSLNFATKIQTQFREKLGRLDRGVKQAGFLVLFKTTMPSVLIEVGFLSNSEEEEYLNSSKGQDNIASAIYNAFKKYKAENEATAAKSIMAVRNDKNKGKDTKQVNHQTDVNIKPNLKNENIGEKVDVEKNNTNKNSSNDSINSANVFFSVQIVTSPVPLKPDSKKFKGVNNIKEYKDNNSFKYVVGNEKSIKEILKIQKDLINKGFKDAFIIAFNGNNRISIEEAKKILNNNKNKQ
jgi:N-acetylmuramoyl-L-alanine amidase